MYSELLRIPFVVMRKLNIIENWMELLKQENISVTRTVCEMLKSDAEINVNCNKKWAYNVKCILETHGLLYMARPRFY